GRCRGPGTENVLPRHWPSTCDHPGWTAGRYPSTIATPDTGRGAAGATARPAPASSVRQTTTHPANSVHAWRRNRIACTVTLCANAENGKKAGGWQTPDLRQKTFSGSWPTPGPSTDRDDATVSSAMRSPAVAPRIDAPSLP